MIYKVDPLDRLLKLLNKKLSLHEYARCVRLLEQQEFHKLHLRFERRCEVTLLVALRVRDEATDGTWASAFRQVRRHRVAAGNCIRAVDAARGYRRYVLAASRQQTLLGMTDLDEIDVG